MKKEISKNQTLFQTVRALITDAQKQVVRNVNTVMLLTYFEIGKMIIQEEQHGNERAGYAKHIIPGLSKQLTKEFVKGYSTSNLEYFRKFYVLYENRISQSVIGKLTNAESPASTNSHFHLSWTHYIQLLRIENVNERDFYEIEASQNNWSVRELTRQTNSALFERVALSKDKKGIKDLALKGQIIEKPTDAFKSHYVLEFLNLKEDSRYSESDLETAIIDRLEQFMLELGKGFLFEGRQRRFTFEGDSFVVDLVFYNRLLRCFVLFDLKIGRLNHQDIGQMQMYVNYYDRMIKTPEENNTIGIILCKEDNKTVIEFTLPQDNKQIFSKEYKVYLPSKEELRNQLNR